MHSFSVISANITIDSILLKTRFFGPHFCHSHFDVTGRQSNRIQCNNASNSYYAVQDHSRSPILVPIKSNTALHPISHSFQVIADYCSNLRFRQEFTPSPLNTPVRDDPLHSRSRNFASKHRFIVWRKMHFGYLEPFRRSSRVCWSDKRTDGWTDRVPLLAMARSNDSR